MRHARCIVSIPRWGYPCTSMCDTCTSVHACTSHRFASAPLYARSVSLATSERASRLRGKVGSFSLCLSLPQLYFIPGIYLLRNSCIVYLVAVRALKPARAENYDSNTFARARCHHRNRRVFQSSVKKKRKICMEQISTMYLLDVRSGYRGPSLRFVEKRRAHKITSMHRQESRYLLFCFLIGFTKGARSSWQFLRVSKVIVKGSVATFVSQRANDSSNSLKYPATIVKISGCIPEVIKVHQFSCDIIGLIFSRI